MRREKKKAKADSGLVPYGGLANTQQSSTSLPSYGANPTQFHSVPPQYGTPEGFQQHTTDGKLNQIPSASSTPRPSLDGQAGWTTVQKVETIYYFHGEQPIPSDSKVEPLQPTDARQCHISPSPSPLPSHAHLSYSTPPSSPLLSPPMPLKQQQSQPQQLPAVQTPGYVPGQGQISGFYSSTPQYMAPPPPYQQPVQFVARKRDRLRPWA